MRANKSRNKVLGFPPTNGRVIPGWLLLSFFALHEDDAVIAGFANVTIPKISICFPSCARMRIKELLLNEANCLGTVKKPQCVRSRFSSRKEIFPFLVSTGYMRLRIMFIEESCESGYAAFEGIQ